MDLCIYLPQANTLIMQIDIIYVACSTLYGIKSNSKFKTKDFIEIQLGLVLIMYVHTWNENFDM